MSLWFVPFTDFRGVNPPTTDLQLPGRRSWAQSEEEVHSDPWYSRYTMAAADVNDRNCIHHRKMSDAFWIFIIFVFNIIYLIISLCDLIFNNGSV